MLSKECENGVLKIDDDILTELKSKHPPAAEFKQDSLLFGSINKLSHCYFHEINEIMIAKAASLTKGAGGSSHLDSDQFCHMLKGKTFKTEAKELREQTAVLARTLASTIVDPKSIEALTTCRLIPLNKNPGVRLIGVGEILRRIIGKAINWISKDNMQESAGLLQTVTSLTAGAEAAVHSVWLIFKDSSTEAIILVHANNAFTNINRKVALHIQITCPLFSKMLINTYCSPLRLIIVGGAEIQSTEGTTQGDNLAMSFYALATVEIQNHLRITASEVKQVWLADDATGAESLESFKKWCINIVEEGGRYGYYVNEVNPGLFSKTKH